MDLDKPFYFGEEWDPDKVKQYFEDNSNDNDFADAVAAIDETDAMSR